ncbi:tetratricopeptide repeat domain protein [Cystobacter fuscus DSM 2262]|uniref:Tetratricopeptide repeat domain protein n=1 Tax=Cystobacter fuscus (strain ATCC 25194 / DSM 2262 / NBRC 100088 / M29) TaxID=1242864 RepID=S9QLP7_CYSF2|nr:tetratricopeptide repeat protein [Cystobacter fuscus]EPX57428.1 tetratricopeptide repeat domain protein [Cystobacter fuscus DSM 2262]
MKQTKSLSLVVILLLAPVALAQGGGRSPQQSAGKTAARALEVYEQGKRLYDAKDYAGALERFDQAAAIEPDKARWQYNRGLALRKLDRFTEAREALLQSRTLDPAYKRAEIDDKLREMGFSPTPPPSTPASEPPDPSVSTPPAPPPELSVVLREETSKKPANPVWALCPYAGMALLFFLLIRWKLSKAKPLQDPHRASTSTLQPRSEELAPLEERLKQVAASLVQVEHALRLKEDADLRALLNQATMAEQNAWQSIADFRKGTASRSAVTRRLDKAHEAAEAAVAHARGLFGEQAFLPEGERVGCYFCARPLANPSFRMQVPLKRGSQVTHVLACPPCANMAAAGQPPPVTVQRLGNGQTQHWSELRGYDPYTHRHQPYPDMSTVPAWQYTPERSLGEVAAMAAGGALATGLAAYGVSQLLDLDSASEAAAAQAATQAAAKQASERREERDWKDHS